MKTSLAQFTAKAAMVLALAVLASPAAFADVVDDFDTGATSAGILSGTNGGWSAKWAAASTQQDLYDNQVGNGVGGSNGVALDVFTAERSYNAVNTTGVSVAAGVGNTLTLSADFQFGVDGNPLANQNASFLGLQISDTQNWWNGNNIDFNIARRGANGQVLGVVNPTTFIDGWINVTDFGAPAGGAVGMSDWFKMETVLTDNGSTYDAVFTLYNSSGGIANQSASYDTGYASGSTLYGGFTTSWNSAPVQGPINTINGATAANIDNFSFTSFAPIPEPTSAALIAGLFGTMAIRRRR